MRVVFEARHDVYVRVEYYLPRAGTVVHADIDAVGLERLLERMGDGARCVHDGRPIFLINVEDVGRVFLWDDKRMSGVHGVDVEERECLLVLVHCLRGEFARNDFAEQAIRGHV